MDIDVLFNCKDRRRIWDESDDEDKKEKSKNKYNEKKDGNNRANSDAGKTCYKCGKKDI